VRRTRPVACVPVPAEVSAYIAARIAAFADDTPDPLRWLAPYVAQFAALPLYVGWTETTGLRADGRVVRWSTEGEYTGVLDVEDPVWVRIGLVEGARRYPGLRALLPRREAGDPDCRCRAHEPFVSGRVICPECGGLGWLPADHASRGTGPGPEQPATGPG
jgi:hypothetical protein